jgi:hypothetical protein
MIAGVGCPGEGLTQESGLQAHEAFLAKIFSQSTRLSRALQIFMQGAVDLPITGNPICYGDIPTAKGMEQ